MEVRDREKRIAVSLKGIGVSKGNRGSELKGEKGSDLEIDN